MTFSLIFGVAKGLLSRIPAWVWLAILYFMLFTAMYWWGSWNGARYVDALWQADKAEWQAAQSKAIRDEYRRVRKADQAALVQAWENLVTLNEDLENAANQKDQIIASLRADRIKRMRELAASASGVNRAELAATEPGADQAGAAQLQVADAIDRAAMASIELADECDQLAYKYAAAQRQLIADRQTINAQTGDKHND